MPKSSEIKLTDWLAIERTKLANQRTLLAMLRTGLYFIVIGITILSLEQLENLQGYFWIFFLIGTLFIALGIINFKKLQKNITNAYKN